MNIAVTSHAVDRYRERVEGAKKIDRESARAIIRHLARSKIAASKMNAIVRVGEAIHVGVVAECIEDDATVDVVRNVGADFAQGFGIAGRLCQSQARAATKNQGQSIPMGLELARDFA